MIERESKVRNGTNGNCIIDDHNTLLYRPRSEDGHLRLVDNRGSNHRAEHPIVGNRECSTLNVIRGKSLRTRTHSKIIHHARESEKILLLRVLDHRDNQTTLRGHLDTKVHKILLYDLVTLE